MEFERRIAVAPAEIRTEESGIRIAGYAAVFGETADIGGFFLETVSPGAFAAAIGRDDVVLLINHEGLPLARTRSGTLTLREDGRGLYVETVLAADDPDVARLTPKMLRGDLDKMSFAFRAVRQSWDESRQPPLRTIEEVELYDVSIVTTPAYAGTEIGLRARAAARRAHNRAAAAVRIRLKKNLAARRAGREG